MKVRLFTLLLLLAAPLFADDAPPPPAVVAPELASPTAEVAEEAVPVITAPAAVLKAVAAAAEGPAANVVVSKRDPKAAFKAAWWPGFFLHGWGHHVAGDQDTFMNLAGGELFGVVMLSFGLAEALGPDIKGESKATSQSIAIAGAAIFGVTWAWDLLDAGAAARRYNQEHNLGLLPLEGGAQVALSRSF